MLREIALWITNQVMSLGYFGIIFLMFIESSFIPFPSEIIMIPAGYLAYRGYFNIYLVIICGIIGSVLGASLNYWIAYKFGRPFLHNNAEKFFLTKERLKKVELFFQRHGAFSTFFGRLVPVIRQYISFPAGLARMNFLKFVIYTGLGAGIWITILTVLGYTLGLNAVLIDLYFDKITISLIVIVLIIAIIYFSWIYRTYIKETLGKIGSKPKIREKPL